MLRERHEPYLTEFFGCVGCSAMFTDAYQFTQSAKQRTGNFGASLGACRCREHARARFSELIRFSVRENSGVLARRFRAAYRAVLHHKSYSRFRPPPTVLLSGSRYFPSARISALKEQP